MGGLLTAAHTAALHRIVHAVAAYCHAANVAPSAQNVAEAQAVIGLLHAGQPGQAAEALQRLKPACEAKGQLHTCETAPGVCSGWVLLLFFGL